MGIKHGRHEAPPMTRRDLLRRIIALAFVPASRLTNRYDKDYSQLNQKADIAKQFNQLRFHPDAFSMAWPESPRVDVVYGVGYFREPEP